MVDVILVDKNDKPIGTAEKMRAHQEGSLHRAFSVFILDHSKKPITVLLQQRHPDKYHAGSLWTNTCCSHPEPKETVQQAGERRLKEELGFTVPLTEIGVFTYRAEFANGLIEHEIDHVLVGEYDETISIHANPKEIINTRWLSLAEAKKEAELHPEKYTPWFLQALNMVIQHDEH